MKSRAEYAEQKKRSRNFFYFVEMQAFNARAESPTFSTQPRLQGLGRTEPNKMSPRGATPLFARIKLSPFQGSSDVAPANPGLAAWAMG